MLVITADISAGMIPVILVGHPEDHSAKIVRNRMRCSNAAH